MCIQIYQVPIEDLTVLRDDTEANDIVGKIRELYIVLVGSKDRSPPLGVS